jgi:Phytanoyl-CoA dioxygenase (PhyH)
MIQDLSNIHGLCGDVFSWPVEPTGWEPYRLTVEQVARFHQDGYLAGVRALEDGQVDALREQLTRLMDPTHPRHSLFYEYHSNESPNAGTVLFHALGAWRIEPAFHDVLWNPAFLMPASQLLGGSVRFWHDQLFSKPAHHGGVVAWHQDYSYWTRTEPLAHLTCWMALDDSTIENGCVYYVPGSHRWNLLPITGLAGDMEAIRSVLSPEQLEQFQPVAVQLKKGECSFHHALTVHGSYENRSGNPRRATLVNVFRDGVHSSSDDELLCGVPPIPNGQPMAGQFFPLLLDVAGLP